MKRYTLKPALLLAAPLLFATASAFGGEGVDVTVTNDSTEDLVVTIYDESAAPKAVVLAHAHLNGFTSVPVSVSPDASGHASISWTATTTDPSFRKCGHQDAVQVGDSSSLTVHADSSCGSGTST
jgi:hypothetical protein